MNVLGTTHFTTKMLKSICHYCDTTKSSVGRDILQSLSLFHKCSTYNTGQTSLLQVLWSQNHLIRICLTQSYHFVGCFSSTTRLVHPISWMISGVIINDFPSSMHVRQRYGYLQNYQSFVRQNTPKSGPCSSHLLNK